jgi:transposase-like protein
MKNSYKHHSTAEKVAILRRHMVEGDSVPDLRDQYHIELSIFYKWQKQFFENRTAALSKSHGAREATGAKNRHSSREIPAQERHRGRDVGGAQQISKSTWETLTGA